MRNTERKKVVHMTTVHHPLDPRIYYKQCHSLQKGGFGVTLIAPETEDIIENTDVNIASIKKHKNRFLRMLLSTTVAYKKARQLKADYYHIHDPELLPVGWLLKKKNNVVIYDIHEDYETSIMQKEYIGKPIRRFIAKTYTFLEKLLSRNMELCLAEKYYKDKHPRGTCILNYPILEGQHKEQDKKNESPGNKLIYTGNVTMDRGAITHARLPVIDENVTVHFFGKCPSELANKMYETAGERKRQLYIEGIDQYVPKYVIDEKYRSEKWLAGIALFPATEHYMKKELTKFFEYMTAGIPIICSDFPKWKEFIETYNCGIAVNPNDNEAIKEAIQYLRDNQHEADQMGKNGQKAILEKLNWNEEEKKLLNWYTLIGKNTDIL